MAVGGLSLNQDSSESRKTRPKIDLSNRHSLSPRYQRTLFIQLIYSWRKTFFVLSRAWEEEKILSAHEEPNLRPQNFLIELAHRRVSVAQWYSIEARNPKV